LTCRKVTKRSNQSGKRRTQIRLRWVYGGKAGGWRAGGLEGWRRVDVVENFPISSHTSKYSQSTLDAPH
jgi:hypothetical protein